ncbi:MAG: molybdenum cofactor guanylyltransferase [Bacteroidota bacterium]|nr:molybdenum cofactor guanylyltransferase [Bacteroidota bacterium]
MEPTTKKRISAAILVGGNNIKFKGKSKANISISGVRIIVRMLKVLNDIFDEIVIVTNKPEDFKAFKQYKIVPDKMKNKGPLGGIHAALNAVNNDSVFVFAGDMPCLSKDIISEQIEFYLKNSANICLPRINNSINSLHAIYSVDNKKELEKYLINSNTNSTKEFLKLVRKRYFYLENTKKSQKAFSYINSPNDIIEIQEKIYSSSM